MSQAAGVVLPLVRRAGALEALARSPLTARLLSVAVFFVGWHYLVPLLETELIPRPARVLEFMWNEVRGDTLAPYTVWEAFATSLVRLGEGVAIAFLLGAPVGLAIGLSRKVEDALHDFVVVGLAFPSLVWALICAMWFGYGGAAPLVTVVLAAITFVVLNVAEGVKAVPKELFDMAGSYEVGRYRIARHVVFPSLMPFFFAAARYAIANGWKGLVLAEVFAAADGAGWMVRWWYEAHSATGVIGYALFFVVLTILLERVVFGALSSWVFRWRPSVADRPSAGS